MENSIKYYSWSTTELHAEAQNIRQTLDFEQDLSKQDIKMLEEQLKNIETQIDERIENY